MILYVRCILSLGTISHAYLRGFLSLGIISHAYLRGFLSLGTISHAYVRGFLSLGTISQAWWPLKGLADTYIYIYTYICIHIYIYISSCRCLSSWRCCCEFTTGFCWAHTFYYGFGQKKACSILGFFKPRMEHAVFAKNHGKTCVPRKGLGIIPRHTVINEVTCHCPCLIRYLWPPCMLVSSCL